MLLGKGAGAIAKGSGNFYRRASGASPKGYETVGQILLEQGPSSMPDVEDEVIRHGRCNLKAVLE